MKINAPTQVQRTAPTKSRKSPSGGAGFINDIDAPSDTVEATAASAPAAIAGIDSLLAAQAVDPDAERRAGVQTAKDVLGALEQLRRGILLGAIPVGRLKAVSTNLAQRLEVTPDPALKDIMTDILLRARVELAKAGIYR
ncbi:MAG: flagellar assembly protein FliX [Pseudomonadota bacterium]